LHPGYAFKSTGQKRLRENDFDATALPIAVCSLLLACALWLPGIGERGLWFDEAWSAHAALQPTLIAALNADATNPPLYYGLMHIAGRLWGTSEFGLRVPSLLGALIAGALALRLAQRLNGRRALLLTALCLPASGALLWAAGEARMYTLLAIGVLVCALAWERLRTRPTRAAWTALCAAELALLYAHNTGPIIVLWLNTVTLLSWGGMRGARPPVRGWIAGQIIVGLVWLPYFFGRFTLLADANSAVNSAPPLALFGLLPIWDALWGAPIAGAFRVEPASEQGELLVLGGMVWFALGWLIAVAAARRARWLGIGVIALSVWLLIALHILGNEFHMRYAVMFAPLALTAFTVALARAPRLLRAVGVMAALLPFVFLSAVQPFQPPRSDDARGMVRHYAETLTAADTVLAWSYADRYDLAYYWDRLGVAARRVTLPEGADYEAILPLIPTEGRIALNVWYTQRADYRGMMGCALEHGASSPPVRHTTAGMTSLLYAGFTPMPPLHPIDRTFARHDGAPLGRVSGVGALPTLPADRALCVPIAFSAAGTTAHPLHGVVIARHPVVGDEIARADVVFATANQRETNSVRPGETVRAFALLRLPDAAPAGEYPLYLRLYDRDQQAGYPPLDRDGAIGNDVPIGVWTVTAGAWHDTAVPPDGMQTQRLDPPLNRPVYPGETVRVEIVWDVRSLDTVTLEGENWQVSAAPPDAGGAPVVRAWYAFSVPLDAAGERVRLRAGERTLAQWRQEMRPYTIDMPPLTRSIDAALLGVGELVGVTLLPDALRPNHTFVVELVWRGEGTQNIGYTAFVQAIDSAGRVAAQSDQIPARYARPTTGWRAGEIILDRHVLAWNTAPAPGDLLLIAGLYDPLTGARVLLADGNDHAVIGSVPVGGS
jgi:hypothetical protein